MPHQWLTTEIRPGVTGGLAPAYAVTSHAAQGDTYAAGRMLTTDTSQPDAVYVGLTRGTNDTRLYTVTREPKANETDPHLPRIDPRPDDPVEALTHQLDKTRPTDVATTRAPDIAAILHASERPLADLEYAGDPISQQAATIAIARITHQAITEPSPAIETAIGPRHDHPDPALWDDAATRCALYRARWEPEGANTLPSPPPGGDAPEAQREEHDQTRRAVLDAQAAHLADTPTSVLAARRNELVAQAGQQPGPDARLLRHDHARALDAHRRSEADLTTARAEAAAASTPQSRQQDPDRYELARRRLADAERQHATSRARLASVQDLTGAAGQTPEALETIRHQIAVTGTALEPRIRAAVANPAPYLIDAIGERPGNDSAWDRRRRSSRPTATPPSARHPPTGPSVRRTRHSDLSPAAQQFAPHGRTQPMRSDQCWTPLSPTTADARTHHPRTPTRIQRTTTPTAERDHVGMTAQRPLMPDLVAVQAVVRGRDMGHVGSEREG